MGNIFDKLSNIKKRQEDDKNKGRMQLHPLVNEDIETKLNYLHGLAIVMNADDEISDSEKEFLELLIATIELSDIAIKYLLSFAENPDEDQINELFQVLSKSELIKYTFIFDCYIIAMRDNVINESEKQVIELFLDLLGLNENEVKLIKELENEIFRLQKYDDFLIKIADQYAQNILTHDLALKWYRLATTLDTNASYIALADFCYTNRSSINIEETLTNYEKAAQKNSPEAAYKLGLLYYKGEVIDKDYSKAFFYFENSAGRNFPESISYLGLCYKYGYGVEIDYSKMVKFYNLAIDLGSISAPNRLGLCYLYGVGVIEEKKQAFKLIKQAVDKGYAPAYLNLAEIYHHGEGVPHNEDEANNWYLKAAEQGDASAQKILGDRYYNGEGISLNYEEAKKWYKLAAEQGHKDAASKLDYL